MKLLLAILAVIALAEGNLVLKYGLPGCYICKDCIDYLKKRITTENLDEVFDEYRKERDEKYIGICRRLKENMPPIFANREEEILENCRKEAGMYLGTCDTLKKNMQFILETKENPQKICAALNLCPYSY